MSADHISQMMRNFLHRDVELEQAELTRCDSKFFVADCQPLVVNLMAYVLGQTPPAITSFERLRSPDLLPDRKLYGRLFKVVTRMPTLQFQFIPLVLLLDDGQPQTSFVMRVRKQPPGDRCVYLDMAERRYDTFDQFLDANRFPKGILWYPRDGIVRYELLDSTVPRIVIDCRRISPQTGGTVWESIAIAGTGVATMLAFTPLGLTVAAPLLFISSVPMLSRSIVNLVDGVRHERDSVVVQRSFALGFSLITFASSGLTTVCRLEKLRRLVAPDVLVKLERAEQLLSATQRVTPVVSAGVAIVSKLNGWQDIPNAEWIEMAIMLCYAFRELFTEQTAVHLYARLQQNGVIKLFRTVCPNVPEAVLRQNVTATQFEKLLHFSTSYLQRNVDFRVDDEFTTITLFGYEFPFRTLFSIEWSLVESLLELVQCTANRVGHIGRRLFGSEPLNQGMLNDVMEVLALVSRLRDVSCQLTDFIVIGRGHHYTLGTVRAILGTKNLAPLELLRAQATLTAEETEQLNALRLTPNRLEGGDVSLLNWIAHHRPEEYEHALRALLAVAAVTGDDGGKEPTTIRLVEQSITTGPCQQFLVDEITRVPVGSRAGLLRDGRFQLLCHGANPELVERANRVWSRTCANSPAGLTRGLETVALLEQLFQRFPHRAGLPKALEYALQFDDATVPLVYYVIVFAWNYTTNPAHLRHHTMTVRFGQLMEEASQLRLNHYTVCDGPANGGDPGSVEEKRIVKLARKTLLQTQDCTIPFGTVERAACWLHLMPALRNQSTRSQLLSVLQKLLQHGAATVMKRADSTLEQLPATARMVLFVLGADKIVVEVLPPPPPPLAPQPQPANGWSLSFYLCGDSIPRVLPE